MPHQKRFVNRLPPQEPGESDEHYARFRDQYYQFHKQMPDHVLTVVVTYFDGRTFDRKILSGEHPRPSKEHSF